MLTKRYVWAIPLVIIILAVSTGCESVDKNRADAKLRWQKATAQAEVPVARGLFEDGKIDEAYETILPALNVDLEIARAHLLMGDIYFIQGRDKLAQDSYTRALEFDDTLDEAWYSLGTIYQKTEQTAKALEHYEKAIAIKPLKVDYIVTIAKTLAAMDQPEQALQLLETKSMHLPGQVPLEVAFAEIHNRLGNTAEAIRMYKHALLLAGGADPVITEALAYCYIADQQWSAAAKLFEKLVAAGTADAAAHLQMLAVCAMNDSQYAEALACYDRLSVQQRGDAELWLKMTQAAIGANAPNNALACAGRALAIKPAWADAIVLQGCGQYLNKDYSDAIQTFRKVTADKNVGGFAWFMTSRCYRQLGKTSHAKEAYDNAVRLDPDSKFMTLLAEPVK